MPDDDVPDGDWRIIEVERQRLVKSRSANDFEEVTSETQCRRHCDVTMTASACDGRACTERRGL